MRKKWLGAVLMLALSAGPGLVWAHEEHAHGDHDHGAHDHGASSTEQPATAGSSHLPAETSAQAGEQTLTGEVVDVFCYLSHPAEGIGPKHAACAKKCIKSGLPVAIRVGNQLYLATMADHNPANQQLAELAGQHVTVRGKVMELEGQRLIAVSEVQSAQ